MKHMRIKRLIACLALTVSTQAMAVGSLNLDVTFTATLRETTCDMKVEGGTGDGSNNTIPIGTNGKTNLADIVNGSDAAAATFKLKIVECPDSLSKLKTTITGTPSSVVKTAITNASSTSPASNVAVSIARTSAPESPFEINSTDDSKRLSWTQSEISSKEVPLIARLIETQAGSATTGNFSGMATFNFEYE